MTNYREQNYLLIRQKAAVVIDALFDKNENFCHLDHGYITDLQTKSAQTKYRFKYVVQKYFMNVTFNFQTIPFKYILPVFDFYFRKKFSSSYSAVIDVHNKDFINRCKKIRKLFPDIISTEEDISQVIKLIMACTLTTYISFPIFSSRREQLKKAYLSGFYLGLAYLIGDKHLDSPTTEAHEKNMLHKDILNFLSDPKNYQPQHPLIVAFAQEVIEHFDPEIYRTQYDILFYLQKIQFEDLQFQESTASIDVVKEKCINTGLKTFLSLQAVQSCGKNFDIDRNFEVNFLYSLLVQLDDDLRDVKKDSEHNIRTLFSHSYGDENFSPHLLYLAVVKIFVEKNKQLSWLYSDYFLHLENKEKLRGLDHDKINLFIEKTTSLKLQDIAKNILT